MFVASFFFNLFSFTFDDILTSNDIPYGVVSEVVIFKPTNQRRDLQILRH